MTDILLGLIAALAGAGLFLFGYLFGEMNTRNRPPTALVPIYTAAEMEEMKRQEMEDRKAFNNVFNYSAAIAYGMKEKPYE